MIIGVLGGGQLGRMLALAGYPMGFRFRFYDESPDAPAGHLGDMIAAAWSDHRELDLFARGLGVATYEFENVPAETVAHLASTVRVHPPVAALETAQDRASEKRLFERLGIPVPPWAAVSSEEELRIAIQGLGLPAVLKTRRLGYDGKGQCLIRHAREVSSAWQHIAGASAVVEAFVPFDRELSIIGVRSRDGNTAFYPLVENVHREGILRRSRAPAPNVSPELQRTAETYSAAALAALDYVGVLAIELFEQGGRLLANEMAPRVHNSGHWTIEGAETSQFENHLRAIVGLPLGSTAAVGQSVMVNLIGELPRLEEIVAVPGAHPHLYGKEPRPRRKVGHVTLHAADAKALASNLQKLLDVMPGAIEYAFE
ncbi:MAG: 5-(carboxyamino)imidazole ribonucleotide synthase [Planctomycetota bacterium]|nr:MAG: 5-(carboxyamino)imidazole ribonucleotide synthase [Planctomycetota bacterium]